MNSRLIPLRTLFSGAALALTCISSQAAVVYSNSGAAYTQNFDSLDTSGAPWANDVTLTGWHWMRSNGTTPTTYTATGASSAAGDQVLSLGNSTDRAFGAQSPNAISTIHYGLQLRNTTGSSLGSFSLSYTGEQWRRINENGADKLTFEYQVFDSTAVDPLTAATGWTTVSALDFTNTVFGGSSTGGSLLSSQNLSSTVTGIAWGEGQDLWLRWTDVNPADNSSDSRRAAMGIDDINFTAVPEPGASLLFGFSALLFFWRRRR